MPDLRSTGHTPPQWTSSEGTGAVTSPSTDGPSPSRKRRNSPSGRGIVSAMARTIESRRAVNPDASSSSTHPAPFQVAPARSKNKGSRHDPSDLRSYGRKQSDTSSNDSESVSGSSLALTINTDYSSRLAELHAQSEALEHQISEEAQSKAAPVLLSYC